MPLLIIIWLLRTILGVAYSILFLYSFGTAGWV